MGDELLSDIVAEEREIRQRLSLLEEEMARRLAAVRSETEEELDRETARLEGELSEHLRQVTLSAEREAGEMLAEARAYAERLRLLDAAALERVIVSHLHHLRPEERHDRPDEQG
jgi:vacuolar-type H+-ATPase subunit H